MPGAARASLRRLAAAALAGGASGAGFGDWHLFPLPLLALGVLVIFSIVSWGIILSKSMALRRARQQSKSFLDVFRKSARFSEVQGVCKSLEHSPLVGLFQAGYAELNLQLRADPKATPASPTAPAARPTLKSLAAVDRALLRASSVEVNKLEQ